MAYFVIYFLLPLLIIHAIYALVIFCLVKILNKSGIFLKKNIFLSFLAVGIIAGFFIIWLWVYDVITLINPVAVFIGSEVYRLSIIYLGNPNSSQAHFTIPWILRIPQVYFFSSIILWGLVGLLFQFVYNLKEKA